MNVCAHGFNAWRAIRTHYTCPFFGIFATRFECTPFERPTEILPKTRRTVKEIKATRPKSLERYFHPRVTRSGLLPEEKKNVSTVFRNLQQPRLAISSSALTRPRTEEKKQKKQKTKKALKKRASLRPVISVCCSDSVCRAIRAAAAAASCKPDNVWSEYARQCVCVFFTGLKTENNNNNDNTSKTGAYESETNLEKSNPPEYYTINTHPTRRTLIRF